MRSENQREETRIASREKLRHHYLLKAKSYLKLKMFEKLDNSLNVVYHLQLQLEKDNK